MRDLWWVTALVCVLCAASVAAGEPGVLTTKATGESSVFPDRVTIQFELKANGENPSLAAAATATRYAAVAKALGEFGFDEDVLISVQFEVSEWVERDETTLKPIKLGNTARHTVQISFADFAKIGPIVDAALAAGATRVARIQFGSTRLEEVQLEALEHAVQRVRSNAEVMAHTAGGKLGALLEMDSSRDYGTAVANSVGGDVQSVPTTIIPPLLRVQAHVSAKWELLDGGR